MYRIKEDGSDTEKIVRTSTVSSVNVCPDGKCVVVTSDPTEEMVVAAPGSAEAPGELTQAGDGLTVSLSWSAPIGGESPAGPRKRFRSVTAAC